MRLLVTIAVCFIALWARGYGKADETANKVAPATTDFGTGLRRVSRTYSRPAQDPNDLVPKLLPSQLKMDADRHDPLGGDFIAVRGKAARSTPG